ncbi:TPA: hypothetical protein EYG84_00230 [Candidatus Gracilibacteria bacterium]|nr:hypothetical protein [Candidatus Gracilibacteria bacterium]
MKQRKNDKFNGEHFYKCHTNKNCGFSTKDNKKNPLEQIDNSDSVASYNTAQPERESKKEKSSRAKPSNRRKK